MTLAELNRLMKHIDISKITIKEACKWYGHNLEGALYVIDQMEVGRYESI